MAAAAAPHQKRAFESLLAADFGVGRAGEEQHPALCHHIKEPMGKQLTHSSPELLLSSGEHGWAQRHLTPWCPCSSQTLQNLLGVQGPELHKALKIWVQSSFRERQECVLSFTPFLPFLIHGLPLLLPDVGMSGWEQLPVPQTPVPKWQGPGKSISQHHLVHPWNYFCPLSVP